MEGPETRQAISSPQIRELLTGPSRQPTSDQTLTLFPHLPEKKTESPISDRALHHSVGSRSTGSHREKEWAKKLIALPLATTRPSSLSQYCSIHWDVVSWSSQKKSILFSGATNLSAGSTCPLWAVGSLRDKETQSRRWQSPCPQTNGLRGIQPFTCHCPPPLPHGHKPQSHSFSGLQTKMWSLF